MPNRYSSELFCHIFAAAFLQQLGSQEVSEGETLPKKKPLTEAKWKFQLITRPSAYLHCLSSRLHFQAK